MNPSVADGSLRLASRRSQTICEYSDMATLFNCFDLPQETVNIPPTFSNTPDTALSFILHANNEQLYLSHAAQVFAP